MPKLPLVIRITMILLTLCIAHNHPRFEWPPLRVPDAACDLCPAMRCAAVH